MIMDDFFSRSEALLGAEAMKALRTKRVIIFGVGGVGSYAAEALIRTGLTHLTIVDGDTVQPSNINRQLPATRATLGMSKVEALKERLLSINPAAEIEVVAEFYHDDNENLKSKILHHQYLIDAIDSVDDKVHLILYASRVRGMKVFSSMGAALRFDPTRVTTGELMTIQGDALAKAVRARMKKIGLHPNKKIRCVYSTEQAQRCETRGSLMQVTATFGLTLASLVIRDLTSQAKL
jgi:tRNA A37 threonylcarbamoyladenosine dehydratase